MKVIVTGAEGLMGRYLVKIGRQRGHEVTGAMREQLDITNAEAVMQCLAKEVPQVVINAAALCHFDRCEEEPALSEAVNLKGAVRLAEAAVASGMRVVLFSSDYIYEGTQRTPYGETDPPSPQSVYARHKAAMETAVQDLSGVLVARCAWVFGEGGGTFMSRMPRLMMEREELTVAAGKRGSCLYAGFGAEAVFEAVERNASGLVNLVHAGETAWEIFAQRCLERMRELGMNPRCQTIRTVPFQEMTALKPGRPEYSVLATDRLQEILGGAPVHWEEGLRRFLEEIRGMEGGGDRNRVRL